MQDDIWRCACQLLLNAWRVHRYCMRLCHGDYEPSGWQKWSVASPILPESQPGRHLLWKWAECLPIWCIILSTACRLSEAYIPWRLVQRPVSSSISRFSCFACTRPSSASITRVTRSTDACEAWHLTQAFASAHRHQVILDLEQQGSRR